MYAVRGGSVWPCVHLFGDVIVPAGGLPRLTAVPVATNTQTSPGLNVLSPFPVCSWSNTGVTPVWLSVTTTCAFGTDVSPVLVTMYVQVTGWPGVISGTSAPLGSLASAP